MKFTWDNNKNNHNLLKHRISFDVAKRVFDDPLALSVQDRLENGEERWQTIGSVGNIAIILVAHTLYVDNQVEIIRIISARKATKAERQAYEQNHH